MSVRSEVVRIFNELLGSGKKISDLPAGSAPSGTELIEAVQGGQSVSLTVNQVSAGGATVTSVSGTTNRISVGGTASDPVIDISATYDAAITSAIDAKVIDSIADSDTTHAPSRNAVFDALALIPKVIQVACSDETTALTTGTKVTFRMPYAMTVTAVRASLTTAQASGSIFTVDIHESGTTILSTKITIDNGEETSTTAATPPVISDTALADDAEITIDIDQIGNGTAVGLKVSIIGT